MEKGARLSKITIGWGVYLVVSASFMLQISEWLTAKVGDPFLAACFWTFSVFILLAVILYAVKARLGILRVCAALSVFALSYLLTTRQEYFAEKTHILSYGLLGYLAARDLIGAGIMRNPKNAVLAISFVALISASDEMFQLVLPYRFGEMKDVITNIVSSALGLCLFVALKDWPGQGFKIWTDQIH
jgi:VanZ family protein